MSSGGLSFKRRTTKNCEVLRFHPSHQSTRHGRSGPRSAGHPCLTSTQRPPLTRATHTNHDPHTMLRITVRTSAMSGRFRPFTICVNLGGMGARSSATRVSPPGVADHPTLPAGQSDRRRWEWCLNGRQVPARARWYHHRAAEPGLLMVAGKAESTEVPTTPAARRIAGGTSQLCVICARVLGPYCRLNNGTQRWMSTSLMINCAATSMS